MHYAPAKNPTPAQARKVIRDIDATLLNMRIMSEAKSAAENGKAFAYIKAVNDLQEELSAAVRGDWPHEKLRYLKLWRPDPMPAEMLQELKSLRMKARDELNRIQL